MCFQSVAGAAWAGMNLPDWMPVAFKGKDLFQGMIIKPNFGYAQPPYTD